MELSDFIPFAFLASVIAIPLGAVYFVVRRIGWNSQRGLFVDAFILWLTWLTSNLLIWLGFLVFDELLSLPAFPLVALIFGFIGSTYAVAAIASLLVQLPIDSEFSITKGELKGNAVASPALVKLAAKVTIAATISFVAVYGVAIGVNAVYDHYNPRPNFGIYDI